MTFIRTGMLLAFSFFITSCSMLSSPFEGVNDDKVEMLTLADTIKTKDLYGAWAIASDDEDNEPIDFLYLVVLLPNHSGLNFLTMDEKNGKPESRYSEYYTWKFNEKEKKFTTHSFKRNSIEYGKPEVSINLDETTVYDTQVYQLNNDILAVRFSKPGEKYTFLKMDNATYQQLVKDIPGIPAIK